MTARYETDAHVMGNYGERPLTMVRGEGVYLYDAEGRAYLDFTAGIAVCALGHAHPVVTQAIADQAKTLIHCSNLYQNPWQNRLAARLAELSGLGKAFFCNSGAEANEAAIKLARRFAWQNGEPDRTELVSLPGGFHGRTFGALSITGKSKYHEGFHPLVPGCATPPAWDAVLEAITERTAACFVEVVQGEGGVHPVPVEVLQAIQARCRETGALLVVDEVQTGVGRTGTFFAFEQAGLEPDIVTMAKGLAGGVPIGAVLASDRVAEAFTPGSHGSTFGGNPLATATALAVVGVVSDANFLAHVREAGAYLRQRLEGIGTEVSGLGLMYGITVPDAKAFVAAAAEAGVLVTAVGETRVRFVPPLVVDRVHIDEMADRLAGVAARV
ncbi:aspartate aminotransferase family protein [Alicyclobacillus macrosporangiidus]|uniref:Acetylornithine aminotransferase n=1 Tax=Alicyclobacillus macrosporangiidus TaxID=392015 RepID=A0A1I7KWR0_9BACL|nr:aspartate aminotransferase family protein [Alicyclobacillus macrosporangiidus]SFV01870.1 acetylornithine aminotransferase/acetylornithine/N-succinyldiaminopimelate aminotransferase [Alicyclobacillus macrosporangiidus]